MSLLVALNGHLLISRVVEEKPPAVTNTRAAFPDPRHSVLSAATPSRRQS